MLCPLSWKLGALTTREVPWFFISESGLSHAHSRPLPSFIFWGDGLLLHQHVWGLQLQFQGLLLFLGVGGGSPPLEQCRDLDLPWKDGYPLSSLG